MNFMEWVQDNNHKIEGADSKKAKEIFNTYLEALDKKTTTFKSLTEAAETAKNIFKIEGWIEKFNFHLWLGNTIRHWHLNRLEGNQKSDTDEKT